MIICNSSVLGMNMARRQVHSNGAVVCGIDEANALAGETSWFLVAWIWFQGVGLAPNWQWDGTSRHGPRAPQLLPGSRGGSTDPPVSSRQSHASPAVVGSGGQWWALVGAGALTGGHWWACRVLSSLLKVGTATIPLSDSFLSSLVHCPHLSSLDSSSACVCHSSARATTNINQIHATAPVAPPRASSYSYRPQAEFLLSGFPKKLELVCACACARVPLTSTPKRYVCQSVSGSSFPCCFCDSCLPIPLPSKRDDHPFSHPPSRARHLSNASSPEHVSTSSTGSPSAHLSFSHGLFNIAWAALGDKGNQMTRAATPKITPPPSPPPCPLES